MYTLKTLFCYTGIAFILSSCTYLKNITRQDELIRNHQSNPSQYNVKHILERDTYFVYGRLLSATSEIQGRPIVVAAFSNKYRKNEAVDINYLGKTDSYYGLNLPEGEYQVLVLADLNNDHTFTGDEIVADKSLVLETQHYPDKVVPGVDIDLDTSSTTVYPQLTIPAPTLVQSKASLFYPKGSIRTLEDPIFSQTMAELGMYQPAAFMEKAPMMFYALEEESPHKIPVIFVHGIGGSARDFQQIIKHLDPRYYKPWFFHYPSGMDLNQLARFFYNIYLSGNVIKKSPNETVIIAHSMGGLIVREALNLYKSKEQEVTVKLFISIASPFGGLASAETGVARASLVLPAWRDLAINSPFIKHLFRQPLSTAIQHHLIYAYLGTGDATDSDGVVPVLSQLPESSGFTRKYGFKSGHAEILTHPDAIRTLLGLAGTVKSIFPEDHIRYLNKPGFKVALSNAYNAIEKRIIYDYGKYLRALANGEIKPIPLNTPFLDAIRGKTEAKHYEDTAWLKFRKDYPTLSSSAND